VSLLCNCRVHCAKARVAVCACGARAAERRGCGGFSAKNRLLQRKRQKEGSDGAEELSV